MGLQRELNLDYFFNPQKIAFIGASERGTYPAGIMKNLIQHGFQSRILPINPNREQVFGIPCFPSVKNLSETPELAILTIPRQAVLPVIRDCIEIGIPAALVISAGFAESDDQGRTLQKRLEDMVLNSPLRLIGPNCAGFASMKTNLIATRLSGDQISGPVSFISQSGALMMSLQGLFSDRQIGINHLVSLGNQVDVSQAELLGEVTKDNTTKVITVFMEGVRDGKRLIRAFNNGIENGKPIVLLKTGRTARGKAAASTHTAALAGEDRVFQAICEQYGVILADDINQMMDITELAAAFGSKLSKGNRIGFISQSGGMGSLTADWIEYLGLTVPPLSEMVKRKLKKLDTTPPYAILLNPADVRGSSVRGETTHDTLRVFLEAPEFDLVVMLFARSMITEESTKTAEAVVKAAKNGDKPLMIVWSGQNRTHKNSKSTNALDIFKEAGIPVFTQPSSLLKALSKLQAYWRYRQIWLNGFKGEQNHA